MKHRLQVRVTGTPLAQARRAFIALHGRGASAADILPLAQHFAAEGDTVLAPEATGHSWYPYSFMAPETHNEPWLSSAVALVDQLCEECSAAVGASHTFLIGFSQGACLALEVAARRPLALGGVAAFIGGLIGQHIQEQRYGGPFGGMPVFMALPDRDPHVPVERGQASAALLQKLGASVYLQIYPAMPHLVSPQSLHDALRYIPGTAPKASRSALQ